MLLACVEPAAVIDGCCGIWIMSGLRFLITKLCWVCCHLFDSGIFHRALVILAKLFEPTRLETRTKESNIYASIWVWNSNAQWKWMRFGAAWSELLVAASWHDRPVASLECYRSYSISVGTRKMVNYAWAEWSQGKPWWRLEAILTCKSFVWPGYRGERLIEPSSSWFPAKFPSG